MPASSQAGPSTRPMDGMKRSSGRSQRRTVIPEDEHIPSQSFEKRDNVARGTTVQLRRTLEIGQLTYSAPIVVEGQTMNVQIATGMGDLWLATDRCPSLSCSGKEGARVTLFRDDFGLELYRNLHVSNPIGSHMLGPVISTNVSMFGTQVLGQGLLTADAVEAFPLGDIQVTGAMGLSPPLGSMIQSILSTSTTGLNNSMTDVTRTGSVLPGLIDGFPDGQRFFALGLQRLPSDGGNGNSTLSFGALDPTYIPADRHNNVHWSSVVADSDGTIASWKLIVSDFSLQINDTRVQIPLAATGSRIVTAIIDSGSPLNYANANFLNALYGAYNVGPAADGSGEYYMDCGQEILTTLRVGGIDVPIHPLDASLKFSNVAGDGGNNACIGSFQAFPQGVNSDTVNADIILGAPFLRSVYTVYSCEPHPPNSANVTGWCSNPTVGLYPLYNTSQPNWQQAISDFDKVRKLGQALGDNSVVAGSSSNGSGVGFGSGARIAVGVVCGFVGIAIAMFVLLVILRRRRKRLNLEAAAAAEADDDDTFEKDAIHGNIDWNKLSENERHKARELAMLHGRFVEEDGRHSPMPPTRAPEEEWDISSKGYWEARAIVREYRKREEERERQSLHAAKSLSGGSMGSTMAGHVLTDDDAATTSGAGQSESHEMTLSPTAPPARPQRHSNDGLLF